MIDAAERALLEETVRTAVGRARETSAGGTPIDAALAQVGWLEMLEAEPRDAVDIVFGALGAADAAATVLDDVLASALGAKARTDLAVLLPPFGTWEPPGRTDGNRLRAQGIATARVATAAEMLVVCATEAAPCAVTVPTTVVQARRIDGVDPRAELRAVSVEADRADGRPLDSSAWDSAVALGRRALAYQISGACRAMLALACDHARERVQFDRPIARFQAVRNRLAEALVALEALDATLQAAAQDPGSDTAALAKAAAGLAARTVAAHCQQVLAGIGFTTEHPFHRFLKRTMALAGLFGSTDEIVVDFGRRVLATRRVPRLIEL